VNVLCDNKGDSGSTGDILEVVMTGLNLSEVPPLDSIHARVVLNDIPQNLVKFIFRLMPEIEDARNWEAFVETIGLSMEKVSVGLIVRGKYIGQFEGPLHFRLIYALGAWLSLIIALIIVFILCWLGSKTMIFTDRIKTTDPTTQVTITQRGAYSLSRIQIAFWTVLVVAGFIYIWLSTDYIPEIPQSLLILMGISGATKVIAGAMDTKQPLSRPPSTSPVKRGFLKVLSDIISDDVSPTISRVQFVIWTLLFGAVFLEHMFEYAKFHDFSNVELILMGISNGTYLLLRPDEQ
jgi:hypothetical protein